MNIAKDAVLRLAVPIAAMGAVILLSNIAVNHPLQHVLQLGGATIDLSEILTWGAFTYPIAFLVTDTVNRLFGAKQAQRVVYAGFGFGVILSLVFADMRIAIASGSAFLIAQSLDVYVFDRLRKMPWWQAPLASSLIGSAFDTALFFSLAFAGTGLPWIGWAMGDFAAKLIMIAILLLPFKAMVSLYPARLQEAG